MKKKLTMIGSSLGLIIDKPIAELYKIDRDTWLEISPKEDGLNIRFINEDDKYPSDDEIMKMGDAVIERYSKLMKNLAT